MTRFLFILFLFFFSPCSKVIYCSEDLSSTNSKEVKKEQEIDTIKVDEVIRKKDIGTVPVHSEDLTDVSREKAAASMTEFEASSNDKFIDKSKESSVNNSSNDVTKPSDELKLELPVKLKEKSTFFNLKILLFAIFFLTFAASLLFFGYFNFLKRDTRVHHTDLL